MGKIFNKGLDEEDKKEGILKRLKNIEKNQNSNNNNNKSNLSSVRIESSFYSTPSSARSESVSDDELEKSVYFPDVANMSDIDNLEPKNETETSFYYLKDKINKLLKTIQISLIQI